MLKMVDGTGIIGVDMICPLGISTPQPPNYDKVELEGTGILVLPNSLDAPLERLELGGKTEQVQTTGKNLFDTKTYRDMNGCEIINNNQISFIQNLAKITYEIKLDSGDYRISFKRKKYSSFTIRNGESVLHTNGGENDYGYNIKLSEPAVISVEFASGQNPNAEQRYVYDIQLEKGTTATPYEQYTGGKPSPSPEYPQEIKNSGKWNQEKQKYEIEVVLSGKNLLDITACEDGKLLDSYGNIINSANGFLTDFIPCFANSPYCRSKKSFTVISFYDRDKNFIGCINQYNDEFITPDECRYFRFSINKQDVDYTKAVANVGTALMDYEPYKKPQTLTITSDRPITKWDRLVEQGGEIGWLYKSKVHDGFDGKNNRIELGNKVGNVQHFSVYFASTPNSVGNANSYCDKYIGVNVSWTKEKFGIFCDWNNGVKFFSAPNENVATVDEFKAWLVENPLKIAYETTKTEFIPLPQSEQNTIRALKTYYPTTVITADGGELDPDIKVTYRKEI